MGKFVKPGQAGGQKGASKGGKAGGQQKAKKPRKTPYSVQDEMLQDADSPFTEIYVHPPIEEESSNMGDDSGAAESSEPAKECRRDVLRRQRKELHELRHRIEEMKQKKLKLKRKAKHDISFRVDHKAIGKDIQKKMEQMKARHKRELEDFDAKRKASGEAGSDDEAEVPQHEFLPAGSVDAMASMFGGM